MEFVKESRIAASPERVFAFHEAPDALARLTPPWEKVEIVQLAPSLRPGSRAILRTKVGPLKLDWVAEHLEYDPPRSFSDRQVSGPFKRWHHVHRFLDDGAGGTILRDEVEFEPPGGALGRLLSADFIRRKLQKMFDYRHEVTRRAVEAGRP
jgi:ligand-binding SRPBCC domain-containing protein